MGIDYSELWQGAAILLALQVTAFYWRIQRELAMADKREASWFPFAECLNLAGILVSLFGVFLLPAVGIGGPRFAQMAFGLVALLFVGHVFALAGHYELYSRGKFQSPRSHFPRQEQVVCAIFFFVAVVYISLWARQDWPQLTAMLSG
jgi:hypothetical protein